MATHLPIPLPAPVLARFHDWLEDARQRGVPVPTAMALATVEPYGSPAVRMVLLKQADADGLVFYTNLEKSRCARSREPNSASIGTRPAAKCGSAGQSCRSLAAKPMPTSPHAPTPAVSVPEPPSNLAHSLDRSHSASGS